MDSEVWCVEEVNRIVVCAYHEIYDTGRVGCIRYTAYTVESNIFETDSFPSFNLFKSLSLIDYLSFGMFAIFFSVAPNSTEYFEYPKCMSRVIDVNNFCLEYFKIWLLWVRMKSYEK